MHLAVCIVSQLVLLCRTEKEPHQKSVQGSCVHSATDYTTARNCVTENQPELCSPYHLPQRKELIFLV